MSNIASFARIGGQVRFRPAPVENPDELAAYFEARRLDGIERLLSALRGDLDGQTRAVEALRAFGLPQNLPETTSGKTTITPARILPVEYTGTLQRVREMRHGA